jgi:hypothetical protein
MQDNPSTDHQSENVPDAEAWEIAFKPYSQHQHANSAYDLARLLMTVKHLLQEQPPRLAGVVTALNEAADVLFPMTDFHESAHDLYKVAIEGLATTAHEDLMKTLRIRF